MALNGKQMYRMKHLIKEIMNYFMKSYIFISLLLLYRFVIAIKRYSFDM